MRMDFETLSVNSSEVCVTSLSPFFFFFNFLKRFYLFMRDTERGRDRQREKQAPCREPDVGLDPGSPGSHPRLQAALNCCATGAALFIIFNVTI